MTELPSNSPLSVVAEITGGQLRERLEDPSCNRCDPEKEREHPINCCSYSVQ